MYAYLAKKVGAREMRHNKSYALFSQRLLFVTAVIKRLPLVTYFKQRPPGWKVFGPFYAACWKPGEEQH